MAILTGIGAELYFNGFDLSGDIGAIDNLSTPRTTYEVTGLNKSSKERIYGRTDAMMGLTTWFNDASGQEHCAFKGLPTTDVDVLVAIRGCAGKPAAMLTAKQINYDWSRGADGSLQGTVQNEGNAVPLEWGTVLVAKTTITCAGNSPSTTGPACGSCDGVAAMLHVTALSACTTLCVALQESSDNGCLDCFATIASFTQATARTSERKTVSGAVERYLRLNYSGTFTSATVVAGHRRGICGDIEPY